MKSFLITLALGLFATQAYANLSSQNYDVGSYACKDDKNIMSAEFTFPKRRTKMVGRIDIKADTLDLIECTSVKQAAQDQLMLFAQRYIQPSHICFGAYEKGNIIAGTSNNHGQVTLTVFLMNDLQTIKAEATLKCHSVATEDVDTSADAW